MNEPTHTPEQFGIAIRGEKVRVTRHFKFGSGVIDLDLLFSTTTPLSGMSVKQIHQASLNIAIQELQRLLELSNSAQ